MQPAPRRQPPETIDEGPFRADQIRDGDPYELSNGHAIRCMSAGDRHGSSNAEGVAVLKTDPAVSRAGVDTGVSFNEGKNLRAPDISVGNLHGQSEAHGENRGRALGQAQSILTVLQARGLAVSEAVRAHILAATDEPTLTRWLLRAATAQAAAEVLD